MNRAAISGWSAPSPASVEGPMMIRSETELELERFFEEVSHPAANRVAPPPPSAASSSQLSSTSKPDDVVAIEKPHHPPPLDLSSDARKDSDEYRLFLKNKLALECAAYALSREPSMEPGDLLHLAKNQLPRSTQLGIHVEGQGTGPAFSMAQNLAPCEPIGSSTLPDTQNKQARPTTSESSRDDSDDELERDTETTDNMGPQDVKRARRMRSNRESARRSRRRKQALLSELEEQVEELRKDKNALLQRQDSWNRKYGDATVEHRILNAEIEALRAKVRMSEERVKQVSGGYNPFLSMPLVTGPMDTSRVAPLPMQSNPDPVFQPISAPHHQRFGGGGFSSNNPVSFSASQQIDGVGHIMPETPAMQDSTRHQPKQIGAGANPSRAMPSWNLPHGPLNDKGQN